MIRVSAQRITCLILLLGFAIYSIALESPTSNLKPKKKNRISTTKVDHSGKLPVIKRPLPDRDSLLQGKYLDMHTHIAGLGFGHSGCFISRSIRESFKFSTYLHAFGVTGQELHDSGDGLVVKRLHQRLAASQKVGAVVVLALDGVIKAGQLDTARTQIYVPNEYVIQQIKPYRQMLLGASINPYRKDAITRLRYVASQGAILIKWIPSIQLIDPSDKNLIPFYQELARLKIPLLTHTGNEKSFGEAADSLSAPSRLELPLKLGVTLIAAHAGVPGESSGKSNMDLVLDLCARYPNMYADISSLTQINKLKALSRLLPRPEAKGRLLYGTDYPVIITKLVSPLYYSYTLSLSELNHIMGEKNAWDKDIALKQALGVTNDIFERSAILLLPSHSEGKRNLPQENLIKK